MNPKKPIYGIISVSLPLLSVLLIFSILLVERKVPEVVISCMLGIMALSLFAGMIIGGIGIGRQESYRWLCFLGIGLNLFFLFSCLCF